MKKTPTDVLVSWNPTVSKKKEHKSSSDGRFYSLKEWLGTVDLPHQTHIRSGILMQSFIKDLIIGSPLNARLILDDMIKILGGQKKEADLLFSLPIATSPPPSQSMQGSYVDTIVYREIKGNINLDSEKRPATTDKIRAITAGLKVRYPNTKIVGGFLCPAWMETDGDVEGLNDFLVLLGYDVLSYEEYLDLGLKLGQKIRYLLA